MLLISDYKKEEADSELSQHKGSTIVQAEMSHFQADQEHMVEKEVPVLRILMTSNFLWLYLIAITHLFYGYYMSNSFKQYGFSAGLDDRTLTTIGSAGALFNGCFKIVWATLLDYFEFKKIYAIILVIQISMLIWVHWSVNNAFTYAITICLSFMCDGSMTSMLPVVTLSVFKLTRGP